MRIEEALTDEVISAIESIVRSEDWSFNTLVKLSGLKPSRDFRYADLNGLDLRYADLRGFDFTGADLRNCLKNDQTIIDESTIFDDADISWLHENETPIVEKMFQIQQASSRRERKQLLEDLCTQYRSERHTHKYLRNLLNQTVSIEMTFDILEFFEPETPLEKVDVSKALTKFALKTIKLKSSRGSIPHSAANFSRFIERIEESNNKFVSDIFQHYLENRIESGRISLNPTKYEVTADFQALLAAFEFDGNPQHSF